MLVGTYTDGTGSQGLYLLEFNPATAEYRQIDTAWAANPSFVTVSEDQKFAYAVNECGDNSAVSSFALSPSGIDLLNTVSGTGADPCNITLAEGYAITSDYSGGTVSVFPIGEDGILGERAFQFAPQLQKGEISHIHCGAVSPDGKWLFVTDLGMDAIYRAQLSTLPALQFETVYQFDTQVHPGPRHLTFSPDGRNAYLISELGDFITAFSYCDGVLGHLSTMKAYDGDGCGSGDVHVGKDGRTVYASHRLKRDGISIFRRNEENGTLTPTGYCKTGIHPRNFAVTPDGKLLLCACRDDNRIEIYSIDEKSGALTDIGKRIEIPAPVCIQFLSR